MEQVNADEFGGPRPSIIKIPGTKMVVPIAVAGRLDATTSAIYEVVGIGTDVITVHEQDYTVLSNQMDQARKVIDASLSAKAPPLHTFTTPIQVTEVKVPTYQTRTSEMMSLVYEALGIDVVDVVLTIQDMECMFTILASQVTAAKMAIRHDYTCRSPNQSISQPPAITLPINGLTLQDFYLEGPPQVVISLARYFGVQFLRVLRADEVPVWVLKGPNGVDGTLTRLRLYI